MTRVGAEGERLEGEQLRGMVCGFKCDVANNFITRVCILNKLGVRLGRKTLEV